MQYLEANLGKSYSVLSGLLEVLLEEGVRPQKQGGQKTKTTKKDVFFFLTFSKHRSGTIVWGTSYGLLPFLNFKTISLLAVASCYLCCLQKFRKKNRKRWHVCQPSFLENKAPKHFVFHTAYIICSFSNSVENRLKHFENTLGVVELELLFS